MHEIRKFIILPNRKVRDEILPSMEMQEAQKFLEIFSLCQRFGTLPKGGGLLDQDSLFVFLAKHAFICQQERAELDERRRVGRHAS